MEEVSRRSANAPAGAGKATADYTWPAATAAILNASPDIQIVLDEDQTILFANAAFHGTNPDEAGPLVGQSLSASLMGRDASRAAGRQLILDAVRLALESNRTVRPPRFRYAVQKDLSQPPRDAWWSLSAAPFPLDGRNCLLVTAREETSRVGESGAAASEAPSDRPGPLIWAERRRLAQMFDQCPDLMSLFVGPDHVFELINPALREAAGPIQLLGRSLRDVVRSDEGREVVARLDAVRATGEPYVARALPFRMTVEAEEDRYLDLTLQPLIDDGGRVEAIFCRGQDVTEQVRAQAVQSYLREELAHRQGNILAVVLALAEQSAVHAPSLDSFRAAFGGRLGTLAAVNTALNVEGPDVSVAGLLQAVARRSGVGARLSGQGGGATLGPKAAITLGLMFHELLQISRSAETRTSRQARIRASFHAGCLHLVWVSPRSRDFGDDGDEFARRLVDHAVRRDFGGEWGVSRRRKSVVFHFEFPLSNAAWARSGAVA